MYDSYKDKWNNLLDGLPDMPDLSWLRNYFSKENLPDLSNISMGKGGVYYFYSFLMIMICLTMFLSMISYFEMP